MDNNKEIIKKKNDLLKAIMSNKKLAKTFTDALSSPIGSTKRSYAKTTFSIMKKLRGIQNDGQGGPTVTPGNLNDTTQNPSDYSNLMIFPAAPKFKVRTPAPVPVAKKNAFDGQGGPDTSSSLDFLSSSSGISAPAKPQDYGTPPAGQLWNWMNTPATKSTVDLSNPSSSLVNSGTPSINFPNLSGMISDNGKINTPVGPSAPATTATNALSNPPVNPMDTYNAEFMKNNPQYGSTSTTSSGTTPPVSTGPSTQYSNLSSGDQITKSAQSAVDANTGPGLFAMNVADQKFGGSLSSYIDKLDAKLKTDFNLVPLEDQLTALKSEKGNLVPTLQTYMAGKDKYLSAINQMIDQVEGTLPNVNMADPATAQRYSDQLNYLYTLKGRQNTRYSTFLNSAIADYNADVTNLQANYDNIYKRYNDAITRGSTVAQNEYNTLYQTMGDLYNSLDQAPTKQLNLEILTQQRDSNALALVKTLQDQSDNTNPKTWADLSEYTKQITVQGGVNDPLNGTLDMTQWGPTGLLGIYDMNAHNAGDQKVMTQAIGTALANTLQKSGNEPKVVASVKKMINDLRDSASGYDEEGKAQITQWADSLSSLISKSTESSLGGYILQHIGDIKKAAIGLAKGDIKDKEKWKKYYGSLDSDFLDALYDTINTNIGQGTAYSSKPMDYVNQLFAGGNDQTNANNLAKRIVVSS